MQKDWEKNPKNTTTKTKRGNRKAFVMVLLLLQISFGEKREHDDISQVQLNDGHYAIAFISELFHILFNRKLALCQNNASWTWHISIHYNKLSSSWSMICCHSSCQFNLPKQKYLVPIFTDVYIRLCNIKHTQCQPWTCIFARFLLKSNFNKNGYTNHYKIPMLSQ